VLLAAAIARREEVPNGVRSSSGLLVPRGFRVSAFATGLDNPRRIAIAPGGTARRFDVFVTESSPGRVRVLRDANGDGRAESRATFLQGLRQPYGLAFHPRGWLYVAESDKIVRVPHKTGGSKPAGPSQFVSRLVADGYNNHWTRNLLFSRDSSKLFATVGSSCNTCEEESPIRATILRMSPDGKDRSIYASGLRNPTGMALRPGTNELWTVVNERDNLGDDVPPDYLTRVDRGRFYGWPYAYADINGRIQPDPTYGRTAPQKVRTTRAPEVPVQAHSAALGVAFYPLQVLAGAKAFPKEYAGDAFLAFHGSWNRSAKTGYKLVRVDFRNGRPTEVTDFVRGFLKRNSRGHEEAWGRPVDVQIAPDGSLLFSDDGNGTIWRVSRA
jgi:glucose/arabinose dehydrogenase